MTLILISLLALIQASAQAATPGESVDPASQARIRAAAPGLAGLPQTTLTTYPVEGRTPRAIRSSMNLGRPSESEGGGRFDSVTRWSYATRWRQSGPDQCLADTGEVTMTTTIILPDLISREQLSARERAAWDVYFERLTTHELNHVRIATLGAQRMQAAIRAATSCEQMQTEQRRISAEVRDASREYDRITEHGKREGAVYPPAGSR